jgi:hypothetical protein
MPALQKVSLLTDFNEQCLTVTESIDITQFETLADPLSFIISMMSLRIATKLADMLEQRSPGLR